MRAPGARVSVCPGHMNTAIVAKVPDEAPDVTFEFLEKRAAREGRGGDCGESPAGDSD